MAFDTKAYLVEYRAVNRSKAKAYAKQYRIDNKEAIAKKRAETYLLKREIKIKATLDWQKNNPGKTNAKNKKRKLAKLQRTPKWLTQTHFDQIAIFYDAAASLTKEFGVPMEVDHIVPLNGKHVSGLHVPWNLQVISKVENSKKSNKYKELT